MSMFDNRVGRALETFRENSYHSTHRACVLRSGMSTRSNGDESISLGAKDPNGTFHEFLRMPHELYDRAIKKPMLSARNSNSMGQLFFTYHWLEEQDKLESFSNFIKDIRNAQTN